MARGVASPAPNPLPKVSFIKVSDEVNQKNPGVHDHVAKTYGYNDGSEFERPEHYIRYIEPLESDLAVQVEYDMDEQDQEWLDILNADRKAQQLDKVSYEMFEIVMDRLEKEWFDLTKNIPKADMALPSEDSTCAICDDSEGENTNAIVFCDGCNLAVHQDCYGVPYIPEGQWLCRKCTVSPENPVGCILCPNEGGAFKQTVSGDWVHLLCAIWIPETSVANEVFMEPITGVEKISKPRWKLRCSVCDVKYGACVQCTKASCFTAFHATCARKEKFLMPMKATQGSEAPTLACYCEKHLPHEQQEARAAMLRIEPPDNYDSEGVHPNSKSNKTMRAYNKQYKPGPPLVPRIIVNRILQYISKIHLRHKPEFVHLVCKYWSLKREARRGAPLLKRLHLEPWTALSGSKQQTDEEKAMKLDHMKRLRLDLERLRNLADVVQRRERTKREQADAIQSVLLHFFFPHEGFLRLAFENITSLDRQEYFKSPVSKTEVPDYYDIIKTPMCWDMIDQKLDRHEYLDLTGFKRDVNLVLTNAMSYNQSNTPFYRTAYRMHGSAQTELAKLDRLMHHHSPAKPAKPEAPQTESSTDSMMVDEKIEPRSSPLPEPTIPLLPPIGDLEPPLDILNLLVSEESVRPDTDIIMTTTPIECLLRYELPLIRPPAPPPPPLLASRPWFQKSGKTKRKANRKAMLERKKQERLDASPGFAAPRTRAALAAAAAFEAEAAATSETPEEDEQPVAGPSSSDASAPAREKSRKPRISAAARAQDLSITVDDVDNKQSFKMFEKGWILPPNQRRGGRVPVERGPVPPPRKRAKTTHDKSSLSHTTASPAFASAESDPIVEDYSSVSEFPGHHRPSTAELLERHTPTSSPQPDSVQDVIANSDGGVIAFSRERGLGPTPPSAQESDTVPKPEQVAGEENHHTPPRDNEPGSAQVPVRKSHLPPVASSPEIEPPQVAPTISMDSMEVDVLVAQGLGESTSEEVIDDEPSTSQLRLEASPDVVHASEPELLHEPAAEGDLGGTPGPALAPGHEPTLELEPALDLEPAPEPEAQEPAPEPQDEEEEDSGPPRIIWIDTLDTPAIRREKSRRKRAEKLAAMQRAAVEATAQNTSERGHGVHGQAPAAREASMDLDSDLTDLSDLEDEDPVLAPAPPVPRPPPTPLKPTEPGMIVLRNGEKLEGGTLVWAKLNTYPWWPAVVFEPDDKAIPQNVLARAPPGDTSAIVRFYEKNSLNNWAWIKYKNMRYLGEDDELDAQMLAPSSKFQRWRNVARRTECRNAYQDALAEMEAEGEDAARKAAAREEAAREVAADSPMTEVE